MKIKYQNRLPHIAPIGATFFITFRLADALPQIIIQELKQYWEVKKQQLKKQYKKDTTTYQQQLIYHRKKLFTKYEHQLDTQPYGSCILNQPSIANIIIERLKQYDGQYYDLKTYCIMPNHVHFLADFSRQLVDKDNFWLDETELNYVQLNRVMQYIKGGSARYINLHRNIVGQKVWAKDSYDHYVRNEKEYNNIIHYIRENPVKAGLVKNVKDWNYTFP